MIDRRISAAGSGVLICERVSREEKAGMRKLIVSVFVGVMFAITASPAPAQVPSDFDPHEWQYGPRWDMEGAVPVWNPLIEKIGRGEPIIGGTIRITDSRAYCAMAAAGYDFTWVEMQHEAITWEQVARMWRTCPGPAAPGVRVAHESEGNIQMPTDLGALVIMVPTVDTVEEAQRAVGWTYFPPRGRRSFGGGQASTAAMWGQVPGGYRATWNENVVLILMIETLEGVSNAREIAAIPGVDGLFAAANDLSNFSGYEEGDPRYEMLIAEIVEGAEEAGKLVCGPLRWMGVRPEFNCFQAGTDAANIGRGAQVEVQQARERLAGGSPVAESATARLLGELAGLCGEIVYEADCYASVQQAAVAAQEMPDDERELIIARLIEIMEQNPSHATRIREIAREVGLQIIG